MSPSVQMVPADVVTRAFFASGLNAWMAGPAGEAGVGGSTSAMASRHTVMVVKPITLANVVDICSHISTRKRYELLSHGVVI